MSPDMTMGQAWLPGSFTLARFSSVKLLSRDRLISMMLQDRGVLRIVSAPHGYGKSLLAYEYARRLFSDQRVVWVDGSSSEFIRALDNGYLVPLECGEGECPGLIVVDDIPVLDETRMETLGACIDELLVEGVEIVVTTLPSCDFLRSSQPDRVLITAGDLLVTEKDVAAVHAMSSEEERAGAYDAWLKAKDNLMGCAPCCVWGLDSQAQESCLKGFFEENVPLELHKAAFAMLLLERGGVDELKRVGAGLSDELMQLVARDYPFLGVDRLQREFETGFVSTEEISDALRGSGLEELLLEGSFPIHEKVLGMLLEKGNAERAGHVMDAFCNSFHCESWLRDCGWMLLDCGEIRLLETLFERCRETVVKDDFRMLAIRSWTGGLRGDAREAVFYAREALRMSNPLEIRDCDRASALMCLLALSAFGSEGDREDVSALWLRVGDVPPSTPSEFLVSVASLCRKDELEQCVAVVRGGVTPANSLARDAVEADDERVERLAELFNSGMRRFGDSVQFRLALHLLGGVNNDYARSVLHEHGCGVLVAIRKRGVETYTQAAIVADLWRSGYFGIGGQVADVRDSKVLALASGVLMRMHRMAGKEAPAIPWEKSTKAKPVTKSKKKSKTRRPSIKPEQVPVANVTLFGGLEIVVGEKYVPQTRWTKRSLQLFAILVMNHGKDVSREVIFQQMWPDLPRARALDNFYTAWSRMQALLGEGPYLSRRGEFCSINTRYVVSDVAEFEQLSKRVMIERDDVGTLLDIFARMETLYRGGLLPSEKDSEFIETQRKRYKSVFVDAMVAGVYKGLEAKDARIALWFARKAMDEDPEREDVYTAMMRAQIEAGQRCSAIRTYFQCVCYLRNELGLDPSLETKGLYEQLIASDPSLVKLMPASFA